MTQQKRATIGLVLVRPTRQLGEEPFFHELIAGIDTVFVPSELTLLLQIVIDRAEERATYRRWAADRLVEGVFLVDTRVDDDRMALLDGLGMPAVVIGDTESGGTFPVVRTDHSVAMKAAVTLLHERGHRAIARVSGPTELMHTRIRSIAFREACESLQVVCSEVAADYTESGGASATGGLLDAPQPPTAIIYDNDLMALGGLDLLKDRDLPVPAAVSVIAWDDSSLCQLSTPRLSAMSHDIQVIGEVAARAMLVLQHDGERGDLQTPVAVFVDRESVAAAPG